MGFVCILLLSLWSVTLKSVEIRGTHFGFLWSAPAYLNLPLFIWAPRFKTKKYEPISQLLIYFAIERIQKQKNRFEEKPWTAKIYFTAKIYLIDNEKAVINA